MALDLIARILVEDKATSSFRKVTSAAEKYRKAMGHLDGENDQFVSSSKRSVSSFDRLTGASKRTSAAFNSVRSSGRGMFNGVIGGVAKVAAAYGGARLAVEAFQSTIGAAAQAEMTKMTITGLFKGDEKTASAYFDFINQKAASSPLGESDFLNASKSFIIMSKSMDELTQLTNVAERLAVLDPMQGLEGAAVALRELNSGDIVSLAERFEMPKKTLNAIKNLPLKKQLSALSAELDKYGITQELIAGQGSTAMGEYLKSIDKVKMTFRNMGFGALEELKPLLRDVNVWLDRNSSAISKFGGSILTSFSSKFRSTFDYIKTNYLENEEFMKLPFASKITEVLDDMKKRWDGWYDSTGKTMITSTTQSLIDTMMSTAGSSGNLGKLADIGADIGRSIGGGLLKGLNAVVEDHPLLSGLVVGAATPGPLQAKVVAGAATALEGATRPTTRSVKDFFSGVAEKMPSIPFKSESSKLNASETDILRFFSFLRGDKQEPKQPTLSAISADPFGVYKAPTLPNTSGLNPNKHSGGLSRVPRNGYPAVLHRDEAVLNRGEARKYRNGGNSGGANITISGNIHIHTEADYQAFVTRLARDINEAGGGAA